MHSLHRFLVDYDMAMLRALAQNRGVPLTTNRQTEAAEQLASALLEPLSIRVALARLGPRSREALESLLAAEGQMRAPHFSRRFGPMLPVGPGRLERETPWQNPANPAEELWYAGLIFRAFAKDEGGPGDFIFVPTDLLPLLPRTRSALPAFAVETVPAPLHQGEDSRALVQDMFSYLVYLQTHDVRPSAEGRLEQRDRSNILRRLVDPNERRLAFLEHLARHLRFVSQQDGYLRLEAALAKRWLLASSDRRLMALQETWRYDPTWNDLCHVPALVCDETTGWHLQYDPVGARIRFLALLARCPLDTWWSHISFVSAIKETDPDFQRPDGDYTSWYIRDAADGDYLSGFESWDRVEGALIVDLLIGPLRWLGIIATVADDSEQISRLTEAGARFLGLARGEPEDQPSPPIVVGPDFCVELPPPANLYTRFQLERFADLESDTPCRYALTVSALGRALARGIRVEQVLAFLQQASETPVPVNVAGQLRIWADRFGQVKLEEVALLRVENERVLRELSVLPQTRSLIGQLQSPTTALVPKENLPRLRKALHALGYLLPPPPTSGGDPAERG